MFTDGNEIPDILAARILLQQIGAPVTLPTAKGLLVDVLGILAVEARGVLGDLQDAGRIIIDNGGWVRIVK